MSRPATTGVFAGYGDDRSHFSRRLAVVQAALQHANTDAPAGRVFVLDVCGGEGRVLLPVVAAHTRRADIHGVIVELDAASLAAARAHITELGLDTSIGVIAGDAGLSDTYRDLPRAQVSVMSGALVHLSPADRARVVRFMPRLCAPNATFIWTIGNRFDPTRAWRVRRTVAHNGVTGVRIERVPRQWGDGVQHEVGTGRIVGAPEPLPAGLRIFTFRPSLEKRFPRVRGIIRQVTSWSLGRRTG